MKGKARTKLLDHSAGLVEGFAGGPSWDFIYQVSTVKHPDYNIGDRVCLPDGRAFRYAKSGGACWAGRGVKFTEDIAAFGIDWVLAASTQIIGDTEVTVTNATLAWTKDELRGGYLLICHATDDKPQFRMITGNNAVAAGTNVKVYVDGGFTLAITSGTTRILVQPSPYRNLETAPLDGVGGQNGWCSHAGIPATYVDVTGKYFWVQTWGPCWCALQGNPGRTASERQLVFRDDGSLGRHDPADALEKYQQNAGFIMDYTSASVTGTWVMLQISP